MELPDTSLLNFFNKVLISLDELAPEGSTCSIESLITQCKSTVFGGQRAEYESVINHCKHCGLIQLKNDTVAISYLGKKFLSANRERYFELTSSQKQILIERIIFNGPWNIHARSLFDQFALNQINSTYELSIKDSVIDNILAATIHFFKYLDILYDKDYTYAVNQKYSQLVYELTADSKAISEQQLEKILMENRKLGAQAENAVVEFERKRLIELGKTVQASLVKRVSIINTAAGFDIESFDGNTEDVFPNRFIEVKATTGNEFRFYWSNNEKEIAKKKKDKYWIYMMIDFQENRPQESRPIMIQDPESSIPRLTYLNMEAHHFLIKEIANIKLSEQYLGELIWYYLV